MFTTDGVARATASAYDTTAEPVCPAAVTVAAGPGRGALRSQSGRNVVTMNKIPRHTVTVWAKTNHKRCINPRGTNDEPGFHPAAGRMARKHLADATYQGLLPQRATGGRQRHDTAYYYRSDRLAGTA